MSSITKMHKRKRQLSENPCDNVAKYFNKLYSFSPEDDWHIPEPGDVFTHEKWKLNNFQELKNELNNVKGQLSNFDLAEWSQHTKTRDPAGYIFRELKKNIKPELLTQAWCKFYECICQFPLISKEVFNDNLLKSVHLCEAPGAFICALNHYIATNHPELKWDWIINSLNPEYEGNNLSDMIPDKRLFNHTRNNWKFGADSTGDIMKFYNYESLVCEALKLGKILLVTADGSINCMSNPGEQECLVEHLHFCEVVTALTILSEGGTFVIKLFTMFECSTICLLYLLNNCFSNVHVFKPCTSKSGNSENYVICLNYIGKKIFDKLLTNFSSNYRNPTKKFSMFALKSIPEIFINQIEICIKSFMSKQIKTINNNIKCFQNVTQHEYRKNDFIKNSIAQCFLYKYKLLPIEQNRLLTNTNHRSPNRSDLMFTENFTVTTTTFLLRKQINLEFEIGLKITRVFYSEFCDQIFLKQLLDSDDLDFKSDLKNMNLSDFSVLYFLYDKDNKVNASSMFKLFHDIILKLNCGNNVIINGCLFLTRFEAALFYLLMSCFTGVQYYSSVIILKVVNEKIHDIRQSFKEINEVLLNMDTYSFDPFILNVLPIILIQYEPFVTFLKSYNNKTLDYYFNNKQSN